MNSNLHFPERQLIELRIQHADLDAMIDRTSEVSPLDEMLMRRLKKRRLGLRDEITRIENNLTPDRSA
ncbi:MAG: YdcH family protein [Pseudomonadota bacterium]